MKKLIILSIAMVAFVTQAQNTFPANGYVGIGTTSPTEELEVIGTIKGENGIFNKSLANGSVFSDWGDRNGKCRVLNAGTQVSQYGHILNVYDFPQSNLDAQASSFIGINDRNDSSRWRFYANTGGLSELLYYNKNQSAFFQLKEDGSDNVYLSLQKTNTYVTIGTNSYNDNGDLYKLTVNGKVRAHAVKVYTTWADYVFGDNYILPPLSEVENYIKQNGHLKDIPSAEEVEKNGIELGEMNKLLLQKIEELTLYTIELKKEIEVLKSVMK